MGLWTKLVQQGLEYFGRYYSSYRAFVIDTEDPKGMNRVKVVLPTIHSNDEEGTWAYPKNNWGGKDYGTNLQPLKGDMVWVEFELGDLDYPIWSHGGYAKDEKPKEFVNNTYGLKTPKGNLVIVDDREGKEGLLVKLKDNKDWIKLNLDNLELESAIIKLGKRGDEKLIMGESLITKVEELININQEILSNLKDHTHSGNGVIANNALSYVEINSQLETLKNGLPETLSNKVLIDKD